jgi:hypothetical protein
MLADADQDTNTAAWSSTALTGRVIAALAEEDPLRRSGEVLSARALGADLGVDDALISTAGTPRSGVLRGRSRKRGSLDY